MEQTEDGLFMLKDDIRAAFDKDPSNMETPNTDRKPPRFVLTGEISTIYKREGQTRKVHHVLILPSFEAAARFQAKIEGVGGNIRSDGRPILGMDSRTLFALLLEVDERSLLIPAHIWTPWFSALGGKSGFNGIEECYGDLARFIPAIETGLSSNPPMNWALSSLDCFSIISNSDAHSLEKLGREATAFEMALSFSSLTDALYRRRPRRGLTTRGGEYGFADVLYTVEFYPQEGKYHYDGHRKCGVSQLSSGVCPKCGKPLTKGVMGRVMELADRAVDEWRPCPADYGDTNRRPYVSLIPLRELIGELLNVGGASKRVGEAYNALIKAAGGELPLLIDARLEDVERLRAPGLDGGRLAEAVSRMREGQVFTQAGFDGEYGVIRVFPPKAGGRGVGRGSRVAAFPEPAVQRGDLRSQVVRPVIQRPEWINYEGRAALVVAGPGSGKTSALTSRVARVLENGADPSTILAITFTVKAARELRERTNDVGAMKITAATFHSFCVGLLREFSTDRGFSILTETEREEILKEICKGRGVKPSGLGDYIERRKRFLLRPGESVPDLGDEGLEALAGSLGLPEIEMKKEALYGYYQKKLHGGGEGAGRRVVDFDDLIVEAARLLIESGEIRSECQKRYRYIFVDEYQDVNFAQYVLIRLLFEGGGEGRKLWAVGDPDQAIYGFRGSDKRFIDRFMIDYPDAERFGLTRSFRCAPCIIAAARTLVDVELQSACSSEGTFLYREEFQTDKGEAEGVARRVSGLLGGATFFSMDSGDATGDIEAVGLDDIAILLRSAALAPLFTKALTDHGVPYKLVGEKPWWGGEGVAEIISALGEFAAGGRADGLSAEEAVKRVVELRFGGEERPQFVERLIETAAFYGDARGFLDTLAVSYGEGDSTRTHGVSVMTIHASKGLEFEHVFIPGLEDGFLPFTIYERRDAPGFVERMGEEGRLFYVAMTRAKRGLYLSWARKRTFRGRLFENPTSRFLERLVDIAPLVETRGRRVRKRPDAQLELFPQTKPAAKR
jgi:DNA helicase-2/ATP-dependent DNA helicase PcrA